MKEKIEKLKEKIKAKPKLYKTLHIVKFLCNLLVYGFALFTILSLSIASCDNSNKQVLAYGDYKAPVKKQFDNGTNHYFGTGDLLGTDFFNRMVAYYDFLDDETTSPYPNSLPFWKANYKTANYDTPLGNLGGFFYLNSNKQVIFTNYHFNCYIFEKEVRGGNYYTYTLSFGVSDSYYLFQSNYTDHFTPYLTIRYDIYNDILNNGSYIITSTSIQYYSDSFSSGVPTICLAYWETNGSDDNAPNSALKSWLNSDSEQGTYLEGYSSGYNQGVRVGHNEGYSLGYEEGYDVGVLEGETPNAFSMIASAFNSVAGVLNTEIFPNFSLGLLIFIPIIVSVIIVVVKMIKG